MQRKHFALASLITVATCALLAFPNATRAEAPKTDPTGTYTWSIPGRNGGPDRVSTLKLKTEGEKVTGTISMGGGRQGGAARETAIENVKVNGDQITFTVTREFNGTKMVYKYNGKISGDTIKGKVETTRGENEPQTRDWEAKRATDKTKADK
jgi:hypothetical protein